MSTSIGLPGFSDPVAEAQATFRAVLDAMARPGTVHKAGMWLAVPAPLHPATAAALLTLVDNETSLWADAGAAPARSWLEFHCGAEFVERVQDATFALAFSLPDLAALPAGSHEEPESSATLILQIAELQTGREYRLRGPGIRDTTRLKAAGLPPGFVQLWRDNHGLYPRGVDIVLCAGTNLAALPRSVSIEET